MTTLYGIWYADYSNSSCGDAVYSSVDQARAVARATGGDVIELELDPPLDVKTQALVRPGECEYHVGMDASGDDASARENYSEDKATAREFLSVRIDPKTGKPDRFTGRTWAQDEKHAIKIVNERRTRWIAQGSRVGPTPRQNPYQHDYGWRAAMLNESPAEPQPTTEQNGWITITFSPPMK